MFHAMVIITERPNGDRGVNRTSHKVELSDEDQHRLVKRVVRHLEVIVDETAPPTAAADPG